MRRVNIKSYLTSKVDAILKLINYYSGARSYANYKCFPHKDLNVLPQFWKQTLKLGTRVV